MLAPSQSTTVWPAGIPEPEVLASLQAFPPRFRDCISTLGIGVTNIDEQSALELLENVLTAVDGQHRAIYFVNAHTLNLATEDSYYRHLLNEGFRVFGDGTGVRWAARAQGSRCVPI